MAIDNGESRDFILAWLLFDEICTLAVTGRNFEKAICKGYLRRLLVAPGLGERLESSVAAAPAFDFIWLHLGSGA